MKKTLLFLKFDEPACSVRQNIPNSKPPCSSCAGWPERDRTRLSAHTPGCASPLSPDRMEARTATHSTHYTDPCSRSPVQDRSFARLLGPRASHTHLTNTKQKYVMDMPIVLHCAHQNNMLAACMPVNAVVLWSSHLTCAAMVTRAKRGCGAASDQPRARDNAASAAPAHLTRALPRPLQAGGQRCFTVKKRRSMLRSAKMAAPILSKSASSEPRRRKSPFSAAECASDSLSRSSRILASCRSVASWEMNSSGRCC